MELVVEAREAGLPVHRVSITNFGRKFKAVLEAKAATPAEREWYRGFAASEGWVKRFDTRFFLKSTKLHGQAGIEEVAEAIIEDMVGDMFDESVVSVDGCRL